MVRLHLFHMDSLSASLGTALGFDDVVDFTWLFDNGEWTIIIQEKLLAFTSRICHLTKKNFVTNGELHIRPALIGMGSISNLTLLEALNS